VPEGLTRRVARAPLAWHGGRYRFRVLRDHFIYHLPHAATMAWPGGGLRAGARGARVGQLRVKAVWMIADRA